MSIAVFLGPTLPIEDARSILPDATYLPPVKQGDILNAVMELGATTLVLIDGLFEQVPAVWHKEILWALEQECLVCGASSMGALRASELAAFGMQGHGRIFDAYMSGCFEPFTSEIFEDDDEVAVIHAPEELGYAGSVAMVDFRATLDAAQIAGLLSEDERDQLAGIGKNLFYKERNYPSLLRLGRSAGLELDRLENWLKDNKVSQKRMDAEGLLKKVAEGQLSSSRPQFRFEHTTVWEQALIQALPQEEGA